MKIKNETSAGGIVYKKYGSTILWLICQHSQHKGWVFPKGIVGDEDKSELPETAALREVREEGGVEAKIIDHQPVETHYSYKWEDFLIKKTVFYYLMEYVNGDTADHDWEMMDAKFTEEKEIKEILTYSSDKKAFEEILKQFASGAVDRI